MPAIARADIVGSLLRPTELQAARQAFRDGRLGAEALRSAEDKAVLANIALQEAAGVDVVSDGEARRTNWIASLGVTDDSSYKAPLSGFSAVPIPPPPWFSFWRTSEGPRSGPTIRTWRAITAPLGAERDIVADELGFLRGQTRMRTKFTFPAPSYHRVFWHPEYSRGAYATVDEFLAAMRDYIRTHVIERAIALGCDYIQMDAPNYGQTYTDPEVRAVFESQGHDLEAELESDAAIDNSVFEGVEGITRALHICRGNGPGGSWSASGGYDRLSQIFSRLSNYDTLLLEYDTPRSGDFSPLRHALPGHTVVLGLLTTKTGDLEDPGLAEQRIAEAAEFAPMERLALSPQCGFASAGAGNPLTPAQQQAKLELVARLAHKLWR